MFNLFFIVLYLFHFGNSQLPDGFKTCDYNNDEFPNCIKTAIADALKMLHNPIPELDLPSFDPLRVGPITVSPGHAIVNFDQKFRYLDIYGFTKAKILNFDINFDKKTLTMECLLPHFYGLFGFDFEGKLYSEPINIQGTGGFDFWNTDYNITANFTEYEKDGDKHIMIFKDKLIIKSEKGSFNFTTDDKKSGKHLEEVFNQHFKAVYLDLEELYEGLFSSVFLINFNKVLSRVPVDQLFGE